MKLKKTLNVFAIIGVVVVLFMAIMTSMSVKPTNAEQVWDSEMTIGNMEAKNYFIIYSDLVCPYCVAFENAIIENEEEFQEYIEENDILVEIRLSDFLYEYGESQSKQSRYSAEAVYCAKNEGKFWDYYNLAITTVWDDYFKDSGKSAFSSMNSLTKDYWIEIGKEVGLGEDFESCVKNGDVDEELEKVAAKMAKASSGLPSFKFNSEIFSGFDMSWGWDYVLMYFEAGLKSK